MLCGIDEAGRGPLAGDLVVVGVMLTNSIEGLNDSKKISEKNREKLFNVIIKNSKYHTVTFTSQQIDADGISSCMKKALQEIMKTIDATEYLFDGNTTFGVKNLQTKVKADSSVAEVSAASIVAKVTHDRAMIEASKQYPQYGFEKHKGYGTKAHINAIKEHGYCKYHRKSYKIKSLQTPSLFENVL